MKLRYCIGCLVFSAVLWLNFTACSFFNPAVQGSELKNITVGTSPDANGSAITLPTKVALSDHGGSVWLNIIVPLAHPGQESWLLIRNHQSVMELVINGIHLESQGQFPPALFIPVGKYFIFHIPDAMFDPVLGAHVQLHIYADGPEIKISRLYLVNRDIAQYYENVINLLNNDIYRYFSFLCFFISVYFLVQFIQRPKDPNNLLFALFTFFIGSYFLGIGLSWIGLPFHLFLAIFKGCLFLGISCLLIFCMNYNGKKLIALKILVMIIGVLLFTYILMFSTNSIEVNLRFRHALVVGTLMFCVAYALIIIQFIRGEQELRPLAFGGSVAVLTGIIDSLSLLLNLESLFWLQGIGIFIFLLSVFLALADRNSRMHETLEGYTRGIEIEVSRRTSQLHASNQALSLASNAKSEFLAHMSHEIRTPLNCIMGFAQILEQRSTGEIDRYYSGLILRESDHLMQLISQVLDLSRIEQGKLILENMPFNLHEAFSAVIEGLSQSAERKGLALDFNAEANLPIIVCGDLLRFQQILINLLGNAIKFTEKGSVSLGARIVNSRESSDLILEVTVNDTGIGIAAEKLDLIFNRFEQADSSITRKFGGTGLGITIARDLVRLMGGEMHVSSTAGSGTRISYLVHLQTAAADQIPVRSQLPMPPVNWQFPANFCILVVDDYLTNIEVIRVFLEKVSIRMMVAESGQEAIETCEKFGQDIDLILMDIHMPDMDGFEATRQIRAGKFGLNIPVIAVTADAFAETSRKCQEAGIVAVLTKPIRYEDLMRTVFRFSQAPEWHDPASAMITNTTIQSTTRDGATDSVIDRNHLSETCFGDAEVVTQLLSLFVESGTRLFEELQIAITEKAMETIHLKAHTIKGGALNVGAQKLSLSAGRLEQKAKKNEPQAIETLFQAMKKDWLEFLLEWQNLVDSGII